MVIMGDYFENISNSFMFQGLENQRTWASKAWKMKLTRARHISPLSQALPASLDGALGPLWRACMLDQ